MVPLTSAYPVQFERGAVNYMISATVTRPTTINPTTSKTYKVKFQDRIDIESMYTPKSRAIYLVPVTRRGKVKSLKQSSSVTTQDSLSQQLSRQDTTTSRTTQPSPPSQKPPLSPAPSEETVETRESASTRSFHMVEQAPSSQRKRSDHSEPRSSTTSTSVHTISATTEITRHGALPGDTIPVRVRVEHTKATRGIIIATLYRQGRIDMLPALPVVSKTKYKKPEYEDVYPKSRTGLGGLYFTNGTPNMAFRKDLTQVSTMMIIDPTTKTADIKFNVSVPTEAFPTMDNIPGGLMSFTYHIEVVIDLTGKLGETRLLPSLTTNGPSFTKSAEAPPNQLTTDWASNILDTAPLRRTKNVASFQLPLIIGTDDTSRVNRSQEKKLKGIDRSSNGKSPTAHGGEDDQGQYWSENGYDEYYGYDGWNAYDQEWYDENGYPYDPRWHDQYYSGTNGQTRPESSQPYQVPPPDIEEAMDEKTRLRRQEELLLPSQPPAAEDSSVGPQAMAPSAPVLNDDALRSSSPPSIPITISRASARSGDTIVPGPPTPPPSLPEDGIEDMTDDKQELERRRLLAQASAPPAGDDNEAGPSNARGAGAPSAPVINDEEQYLSEVLGQEGNEGLPQYQR